MYSENFKTAGVVSNWQGLVEAENKYSDTNEEWIFRGDSCDRPLQSTLERLRTTATGPINLRRLERQLFNDFKRSFQIHSPSQQSPADDVLYWLSLMRHFGTPTRLLDFTYSLFIATFFALERQEAGDAVVWLVSKTWLTKPNVKAMFEIGAEIDGKTVAGEAFCSLWGQRASMAFQKVFWNSNTPYTGVFPVNPATSHRRLHLQQGLFLCPVDVERSFSANLRDYTGHEDRVLKLLIRRQCREDILLKLHRAGTNRDLLFPGLDGFALGLQSRTPIIYSNLEKLGVTGARVATNDKGEFLFGEYYDKYCK
jgi:hypothetical protein